MNSTFLKAAASYLGLPTEGATHLAWGLDETGALAVIATVPVSDDDLAGIADRMKVMQAEAPAAPQADPEWRPISREEMREAYNALSPADRSRYGSFARYVAVGGGPDPFAAGAAQAAQEKPEDGVFIGTITSDGLYTVPPATVAKIELPPHVYLTPAETTPLQRMMAVGRDEKGNYAIAPEDLTEAQHFEHFASQDEKDLYEADNVAAAIAARVAGGSADELRAGYVERTMAAADRLTGADGKPTSNATDFGGLPG